MPRSPRGGSWAEEYRRRIAANPKIPTAVARGHGVIPAKIARGVEDQAAGRPRALPVATQVRYRSGIGAYEKRYKGGRLVTGHAVNLTFPSERAARRYLSTFLAISPDSEYVEVSGSGTEWTVTLLR